MTLKTTKNIRTPNLSGVSDPLVEQILVDLCRTVKDTFNNVYQDLNNITNQYNDLGAPGTNGSWRLIQSGNNLSVQRLEGGVWVEKSSFHP